MIRKLYPLPMVFAVFTVLILVAFPKTARAQTSDWDYIRISPLSGNWNYPGYFVLKAEREVTVSWWIKCTHGGCDRPDEFVSNYTFSAGEILLVGWGHQCYRWQLDPVGRPGFIAEPEPELCVEDTPTPTATQLTPEIPPSTPGTPAATPETPGIPPGTPAATPETPAVTPETPGIPPGTPATTPETPGIPPGTPVTTPGVPGQEPTPTSTVDLPGTPAPTPTIPGAPAPPPAGPPGAGPTEDVILPITGEGPPASRLASPLWPALASLLLLGLAGRMVWAGILQSESIQITPNLYPGLRSQARKALILILVSLLILAFLVLPSILRQAALDFGEPGSYNLQAPELVQELPPNFLLAPVDQEPALEIQAGPQALDEQPTELFQPLPEVARIIPAQVSARKNSLQNLTDSGNVTRLVIPALKVNSKVSFIPFEDRTWDIQELGMDIAWLGNTSSPALGSNTVLAGHITVQHSSNGPFRYLYHLRPGDLVHVHTLRDVYTYAVRDQQVVMPNDSSVIGPTDGSQITLLTCTGWDEETRQYTHRRAVFADLVSVSPSPKNTVSAGLMWE